jgi:membrane-associated phospholipid phosphatase
MAHSLIHLKTSRIFQQRLLELGGIRDSVLLAFLAMFLITTCRAQGSAAWEETKPQYPAAGLNRDRHSPERAFILNIASDQKALWTSPRHIRVEDAHWLLPLGAFSAGLIASDTSIEKVLPASPSLLKHSQDLAKYATASVGTAAGALYLWGLATQNDHARETGLLSGEALTNVLIDTSFLKFSTGRQRPLEDNGRGRFWRGGRSFPSDHAAAAWSIASVVAHEYPGPLTKLIAYGSASAVSATRVLAREHFTSEAVIGSALGWWVGRQVYRARHNPELDGAEWGTFARTSEGTKPEDMGSPYVPLDAWVYPVFDRLAALGFVQTGFAGMRPWTRLECARLVQEAGSLIEQQGLESAEGLRLYRELAQEFAREAAFWEGARNHGAEVESIYTRATGISGPPLIDGYHFGQTLANDFGRPYAQGFNTVSGVSAFAQAGSLAFYFRGEYQHAAAPAPVPDRVRATIAGNDQIPLLPAPTSSDANRFRLLDSYVSFGFKGFQISAGRQNLWWGPGRAGPLLLSDNAEPVNMVRISRTSPRKLPSILSWLGPVRSEFFFGKLEGHQSPPRPFIHGQKFSFKPTPNLEFGFSRTVIFAGLPQPLTWGTFLDSFFSGTAGNPDPRKKPGDRRGGFDFSYRIPGLRKWLTLYNDSLVEDDPSPLANPRRAAMNPGLYLAQVPRLPKLDLRVEAVYTDVPTPQSQHGDFIYWEFIYRDSHTNHGNLMGNWIGREGKGVQAWSTYWLSPRSTIQFNYRNAHVAKDFLQGGSYRDFGVISELRLRADLSVRTSLQYERWKFPLLSPNGNKNIAASVQVVFSPHWRTK